MASTLDGANPHRRSEPWHVGLAASARERGILKLQRPATQAHLTCEVLVDRDRVVHIRLKRTAPRQNIRGLNAGGVQMNLPGWIRIGADRSAGRATEIGFQG